MPCNIWTQSINKISEDIVDVLRDEGKDSYIIPPGGSLTADPISLVVVPWFGAHRHFQYSILSTVVSEIWQAVLADGCRTYNFEVMIGKGHGMKEGDHIGSIEIQYFKNPKNAGVNMTRETGARGTAR